MNGMDRMTLTAAVSIAVLIANTAVDSAAPGNLALMLWCGAAGLAAIALTVIWPSRAP